RRRERRTRIRPDALHHGTEPVRALRRQMLAQAQTVEYRDRVGRKDFARRPAGIEREQDRDQAAHDVGVTVADELDLRAGGAVWPDVAREPDLAGAALNLVGVGALRLRQRLERAAEFDHIAVAIVPIIEEREVFGDLVD